MTEIINTPSSRDPFQLELYEAVKNYKSRNKGMLNLQAPTPQNGQAHSTIRRLLRTNCLRVFDHFVGLSLEVLKHLSPVTDSEQESLFKVNKKT